MRLRSSAACGNEVGIERGEAAIVEKREMHLRASTGKDVYQPNASSARARDPHAAVEAVRGKLLEEKFRWQRAR